MATQSPLYITRTAEGIWYYQRWMPKYFRSFNLDLSPVFRLSLRTKNKKRAIRLSRVISVKIDKLALDHFEDPDDFARGMKLLYESISALTQGQSFEDYEENFLMDLDELDEWLLSKAECFNQKIQSEFGKLQQEITVLREALRNSKSVTSPEAQEELITKIRESIHPPLSDEENPTLSELFEEWKEANKGRMVETSYENSYKPAIELFIRFADDYEGDPVRINNLKPDHIRHYQKHYQTIPKGTYPTEYTISRLIRLKGPAKAPKTILLNYANVSTFLSWIAAKGFPINTNLLHVLKKGTDVRLNEKQRKQRKPFTDEDLVKLFNSEDYVSKGKFKTSAMYWSGLISLFSGARMSEILQLEKHDIQDVDGIWAFKFDDIDHQTTDSKKHVKKDGSRRLVPIHKQLLKLGFLDYVGTRKTRLFPDEERNDKGKFDSFQKRHTTYRKKVSVVPDHNMELKDFHSFRHTARTRLTELRTTGHVSQRFDEGIIDAIVGHASKDRSVGQTTYNHSQYMKAKKKALDRLQYDSIDFGKIISWEKCEFARKAVRRAARKRLE
jgi:integrase